MANAQIYFGKAVTADTASALVHAAKSIASELNPQGVPAWDKIEIAIASGGGDVISALGAYNELKRLKAIINTHNSGAVDSAVILPFMVGRRRTASSASSFFFHQVQWSFPAQSGLQTILVKEATKLMEHYTETTATIVSARSKLSKRTVRNWMLEGTLVNPKEALEHGLIHEIVEPEIPPRTWQV
jgi:ATP-dependent protease ClpP protease subunit